MIIYKTTNLLNNKIYVGFHSGDNENYLGSGTILKEAIKKYGKENFKRETLEIVNENNWGEREQYWIDKLNATNKTIGYNITEGGNKGPTKCGKDNGMYGKTHTNDVRKKISNMKKKLVGDKHPHYGKTSKLKGKTYEEIVGKEKSLEMRKHKSEIMKKIRNTTTNSRAKSYILISPDGNEYEVLGKLRKKCEELNISYWTMFGNVNKGKIKKQNRMKNYNAVGWEIKEID